MVFISSYKVGCGALVQLGGSDTGIVTVVPANVKACKSIIFTEGIPEVAINNTSHNQPPG